LITTEETKQLEMRGKARVSCLFLPCWCFLVNSIERSDNFWFKIWSPHQISWRSNLLFWHFDVVSALLQISQQKML